MVKIFCLFLSLLIFIHAESYQSSNNQSLLQSKILNILGDNTFNRNKNFINKIFANEESFYQNGSLNIYKVISTLQSNGLLKLKFRTPQEFSVIFTAQTSPIFLLRSINKSLSYMGYSYWTTSEANYENEISRLKISLLTEHIIDPVILLNELAKHGFVSLNINRNLDTEWEYQLMLNNSKVLDSRFIAKGNSLDIIEVAGEYWLEVGSFDGRLFISTLNNKSFNPRIIFFDNNLNILEVQNLSPRNSINIKILENTKFIQIKDSISSSYLKNGINVKFK